MWRVPTSCWSGKRGRSSTLCTTLPCGAPFRPLIQEHAPELLAKDEYGNTPLNCATKRNTHNPAVVSFFTEADTAFNNGDYPALIKLCGATPSWEEKAMASPNSAKRKPAKKTTKIHRPL